MSIFIISTVKGLLHVVLRATAPCQDNVYPIRKGGFMKDRISFSQYVRMRERTQDYATALSRTNLAVIDITQFWEHGWIAVLMESMRTNQNIRY